MRFAQSLVVEAFLVFQSFNQQLKFSFLLIQTRTHTYSNPLYLVNCSISRWSCIPVLLGERSYNTQGNQVPRIDPMARNPHVETLSSTYSTTLTNLYRKITSLRFNPYSLILASMTLFVTATFTACSILYIIKRLSYSVSLGHFIKHLFYIILYLLRLLPFWPILFLQMR